MLGIFSRSRSQPLPGGLVEEAVGHVEGGAAPHLQGEAVVQDLCRALGGLEHVAGAHPGGQQGLVGVPHGGVGDEQLLLSQHPVRAPPLGPSRPSSCLRPVHFAAAYARRAGSGECRTGRARRRGYSPDICAMYSQQLGGTVAALVDVEQLGRLVNELGVALPRPGRSGGSECW